KGHQPHMLEFDAVWDENGSQKDVYESAARDSQPQEVSRIHESEESVFLEGLTEVSSRGVISDGRRYFQTAHENPQEAKILKRSLTIFGNVIFALSSPGCQHIPYRESKLTRILRDCLGGNCLTSLIVTVSSDLSSVHETLSTPQTSSVHETLSTLQFATRAMAIPSRPVRNSQIQSCAVQVSNSKNIEKPKTNVGRPQTEFPCIGDNKTVQMQTCLPPILFSTSPPSRSSDRRRKESLPKLEHPRELKVTLPHLEKSSEKIPYLIKSAPAPEKNKLVEERGKSLRSRSSSLVGPPDPLRDKQPRLEPASPRVSVERLPPEMLKAVECPNCKKERRIRDEYDKYIIQSRRDKDTLQQKIAELEADLRRCKDERVGVSNSGEEQEIKDIGHGETVVETHRDKMSSMQEVEQFRKNLQCKQDPHPEANEAQLKQTCSARLQQAQLLHRAVLQERDGLLIEIKVLKAQLDKAREREKAVTQRLKTEQDRVTLETEDLRSQLEKSKEREKQQICRLENEKARILLELEDMKAEFKRFKDRVTLTLADLKKEKIKSENSSVLEKLETLQREHSLKHNGCYQVPPHEPPHMNSLMTNTEMMMIQVSQQSAAGIKSGWAN
ncbi:UNVERIFIED_CONTAM: hypothetical protein FKN15_063071, partial [Acipenser sinensis]